MRLPEVPESEQRALMRPANAHGRKCHSKFSRPAGVSQTGDRLGASTATKMSVQEKRRRNGACFSNTHRDCDGDEG